jgi:hypothetical protein
MPGSQRDLPGMDSTPEHELEGWNKLQHGVSDLGRAVQIDPMKPMLKAPGSNLLKLKYDVLLSNFAVNFSLSHYTSESMTLWTARTA